MTDFTYMTPANQAPVDFDDLGVPATRLNAFLVEWNAYQDAWTKMSIVGNPWSNEFDAPRPGYIDPAVDGWPAGGAVPVMWTPFPARLTKFFGSPESVAQPQIKTQLSAAQLNELAATGGITLDGTAWTLYSPDPKATNVLEIPAVKCPQADWAGPWTPFVPAGPRGWLDEYNEYCVTWSDGVGSKITSVQFTSENPAYWLALWQYDPSMVTELYQKYVDPAVAEEDLYLRYPDGAANAGEPVMDPTTGRPAYDPTNKWNSGTLRVPGQSGGAMHLTSPPNTLSAEVYLAAASTILRSAATSADPQALLCCSKYGQNFRNSDPNIGATANSVAAKGFYLTLTNPVGLYMQTPNWSLFRTPDGTPASEFWTVRRGTVNGGNGNDSILQAVFEVPASKGYTVSDIEILDSSSGTWSKIQWASQMQQTFKIALRVTPQAGYAGVPQPCVTDREPSQPYPVQLVPQTLFLGVSPTDLLLGVTPGTTTRVSLVVQGASADTTAANARIQFQDPAISATVVDFLPDAGSIPGQTSGSGTQVLVADLTVGAAAAGGLPTLRVLNPDEAADIPADEHPWAIGLLYVKTA
ncbi:hypothetical protein ACM64Y_14140 [Novispirillum sp. DQ9]|uniref:hypothetical protein n=1 Tax=Novispirillum sp. DQ9 TaxID=3398612 RepID=UPI003C7D8A99